MNKMILACLTAATTLAAIFAITTAEAQITQNQGQQTTLHIDIAIEKQEIIAGPYARYAQKYLGVSAPLADKVLHEIKSVRIMDVSGVPFRETFVETGGRSSHMSPLRGFPRLTVDKMSAATYSLEESARLAAEKIFEIRRSRFDLITGEVGENVFGGGLSAALSKLDELEEQYLSLFLGKQTTRTELKQYTVTPVKEKSTYTVCRFSETDGLLPQDNLSGVPMVLELRSADGESVQTSAPQAKPNPRAVPQLIPAQMQCRIILDGAELASEQFSIRQMGEVVYVMP